MARPKNATFAASVRGEYVDLKPDKDGTIAIGIDCGGDSFLTTWLTPEVAITLGETLIKMGEHMNARAIREVLRAKRRTTT